MARDEKTGQDCALKILHRSIFGLSKDHLTAFQKEFEILKRLRHPSIAQVYDAGFAEIDLGDHKGKEFFFTTEFVDGKKLTDATLELSLPTFENLLVEALRALNYIHSQDIYHLDIKPSNLLVAKATSGGHSIKLIDFGFAVLRKENVIPLGGTSPYISPEMILRETIDGRSDLYSLGCTFYQALTGRLPIQGKSDEDFFKNHLKDTPKRPTSLNPDIPKYLDQVLLTLLEKKKEDRYPSAKAVIEALNLSSNLEHEIEPLQTLSSYLPDTVLIGRDKAFDHFLKKFEDRIYSRTHQSKPYLIILGEEGTGKTRFLEECKTFSQKQFIRTLAWSDLMEQQIGSQLEHPVIVLADDHSIDSYDLEFLESFYEGEPLLVLIAMEKTSLALSEEDFIELQNFGIEDTKQYILKATGIEPFPEELIHLIHQRTMGNPLYITEYFKEHFDKHLFKDRDGLWDEALLEDLKSQIEEFAPVDSIKERLKKRIGKIEINENQWELLTTMALTGRPTLTELIELTDSMAIEKHLKSLVAQDLLRLDTGDQYVFANPLYREVILEKMEPIDKARRCDAIADYLEHEKAPRERILYYRGRGEGIEAPALLLELAGMKRTEEQFEKAHENLKIVLSKPDLSFELLRAAIIEMAGVCLDLGRYEEAREWLQKMEARMKKPSDLEDIKCLELMGMSYFRRHRFDEANQYFKKGYQVSTKHADLKWMQVQLKGRIAYNLLEAGKIDESEKLFLELWKCWKEELNEEEKLLAIRLNIDRLYFVKNEYEKVVYYLEEILKILSKAPHLDIYPLTLFRLGSAYVRMKKINEAEEQLNQCLEVIKRRRTPQWLYLTYNELGNVEDQRKNYDKALNHYGHAFKIGRKTGASYLYMVSFNIAQDYKKMAKISEAKKYYHYTLRLITKTESQTSSKDTWFHSLLGLADCAIEDNESPEAKKFLSDAENLMNKNLSLNAARQYILYRKADLARIEGDERIYDSIKQEIEGMKKQSGFDAVQYEQWLEKVSSIGPRGLRQHGRGT